MKSRFLPILFLAAVSSVAYAGYSFDSEVSVSSISAYGALAAARYSTDTSQYIGCVAQITSSSEYAYCFARNEDGDYLSCTTTDTDKVDMIKSLNPYGWVSFSVSSGSCSTLRISSSSYDLP